MGVGDLGTSVTIGDSCGVRRSSLHGGGSVDDAPCDLKFVTNTLFYHTRPYDFTILRLSYLHAYLETAASPRGQTPQ